jgi:histidine ammonia-lyase
MKHQDPEAGHQPEVTLTGDTLTIEDVVAVARKQASVAPLVPNERMLQSRQWVEDVIHQKKRDSNGAALKVYGVNTPFGSLAYKNSFETPQEAERLSRNLIMSHSAGVGRCFAEDVVRAATLIRANTLARGFSGIRPGVINSLIGLLNANIYPAVPEKGSVGASGDLAPLSHLALVISKPLDDNDTEEESGEILVDFDPEKHSPADCIFAVDATGNEVPKARAYAKATMEAAGVERWRLEAKEGLALNNGASFCAAMAALAVSDAELLIRNAEIALAMSVEGVRGYRDAFFPQVHRARGHQGAIECADNVLRLLKGSNLLDGDEDTPPRRCPPQDAYSLRCAPQVLGAARDVIRWVRHTVETELNAATDNPLIFASEDKKDPYFLPREYKAVSCGNFHGEPLAFAMDFLGIAVAEVGNIAERRIFRLVTDTLNRGLESCLVKSPEGEVGTRNGFMLPQYTAAALVSDNKTLAHPDSVDSIPTGENQEDHVSMAPNAARHAREILWNVQQIVGIEMLCAAQALDFRRDGIEYYEGQWRQVPDSRPAALGVGTAAAHDCIRSQIAHWDQDRVMYPDLNRASRLVSTGEIVRAVEQALGSALR